MKKVIRFFCISVVIVALVFCFVGCGESKPASAIKINNTFDETKFVNEMASVKSDNVNFATNGASNFAIVYPDILEGVVLTEDKKLSKEQTDIIALKSAVDFLAQSLNKIVGCNFKTMKNSAYQNGSAIFVKIDSALTNVKNSGYALSISTGNITISAKDNEGLKNGIYSFLEKYLGCMFVAVDYDYLPNLPTINFAKTETFHNPDIVWREVYAYESEKNGEENIGNQWFNKLKINGAGMGGWGNWCHTFFTYIPPEEFFETHPEYFAEYNGTRKYQNGPVSGQLCLTNEDVYKIIEQRLFDKMAENPEIRYWDVSQMDTWINRGTGCTCENCKKLDDAEGSPMGSLLTFINRLADECAVRFPNNFISTLAYNYSATPPKTLKPRDNVIIKLCFMPGDVTSDIKNPRNENAEASNKIITEWSKISKNLLIWDYNINFHQYLMPYPIYTALQTNNDFYIDNNVYGIFHQMGRDIGGYSAELSAYVFSQIMWDKTVKVEDILSKYMAVYYKQSAQPMIDYYNALEKNAIDANRELYIYSTVSTNSKDYLSIKNVDKYLEMFNQAELLAGDDAQLLDRIQKNKIGVLYVKAQECSLNKSDRKEALEEFKFLCDKFNIDSIYEGNPDLDNEVQTFYEKQLKAINGIPWIIATIVVGSVAIGCGCLTLGLFLKKRCTAKTNKE
ncbi:MAG: DUF4838 domain-containing protein [Clostridia bacterium]